MTVNTQVVQLFLRGCDMTFMPFKDGLRLQILPDTSYLPQCQKHHFAAFIRSPPILVVWDDQPNHILERAKDIEDQLMTMIWTHNSYGGSRSSLRIRSEGNGKGHGKPARGEISGIGTNHNDTSEKACEPPRNMVFVQPINVAVTLMLVIGAIGHGTQKLAIEIAVDHRYIRCALLIAIPLQIWLALVR